MTTHRLLKNFLICVPESQRADYTHLGAVLTHPDSVKGLAAKRNWILEELAGEDSVVMLDDDLTGLSRMSQPAGESSAVAPSLIEEIISSTASLAEQAGCFFFGWETADHPEFFSGHRPFCLTGFINGCAMGFVRGHSLRFDPRVVAKEDYDISAANARRHRKCFRDLRYAWKQTATFCNPGGQAANRNSATEAADVALLKRKWGEVIVTDTGKGLRKAAYAGAQKIRLNLPF